jgi:hypothetical protein
VVGCSVKTSDFMLLESNLIPKLGETCRPSAIPRVAFALNSTTGANSTLHPTTGDSVLAIGSRSYAASDHPEIGQCAEFGNQNDFYAELDHREGRECAEFGNQNDFPAAFDLQGSVSALNSATRTISTLHSATGMIRPPEGWGTMAYGGTPRCA